LTSVFNITGTISYSLLNGALKFNFNDLFDERTDFDVTCSFIVADEEILRDGSDRMGSSSQSDH